MNRLRKSSGHIFQGRYKAHLVEDEPYGTEASRYIHLNPVRVKRMSKRRIEEKREYLRRYKWSSYPASIGVRKPWKWLNIEHILSYWGCGKEERMKAYWRYVEEGLNRDNDNPFIDVK